MNKILLVVAAAVLASCGVETEQPETETGFVYDSVYLAEMELVQDSCGFGTVGVKRDVELRVSTVESAIIVETQTVGSAASSTFMGQTDGDSFFSSLVVNNGGAMINNVLSGESFGSFPTVTLTQAILDNKTMKECRIVYVGKVQ